MPLHLLQKKSICILSQKKRTGWPWKGPFWRTPRVAHFFSPFFEIFVGFFTFFAAGFRFGFAFLADFVAFGFLAFFGLAAAAFLGAEAAANLKEPDAPVPLVRIRVPSATAVSKYFLIDGDAVSKFTLYVLARYFLIACSDEPPRSFKFLIALTTMDETGGWDEATRIGVPLLATFFDFDADVTLYFDMTKFQKKLKSSKFGSKVQNLAQSLTLSHNTQIRKNCIRKNTSWRWNTDHQII